MKYTSSEGLKDDKRKRKKTQGTNRRTYVHSLIVGSAEMCGENIFKEGERRIETESTQVLGGFGGAAVCTETGHGLVV